MSDTSVSVHGDPSLKPIIRVHCVYDKEAAPPRKPKPTWSYFVAVKHCETGEITKFDGGPGTSDGKYPTTRIIHGLAPAKYIIWPYGGIGSGTAVARIIDVEADSEIEITFDMVHADRAGITNGVPDDPRDGSSLDPEMWERDYRNPHGKNPIFKSHVVASPELTSEEIAEIDAVAEEIGELRKRGAGDLGSLGLEGDEVLDDPMLPDADDDEIEEARHEYKEFKPRYFTEFDRMADPPVTGLKARAEALLVMATALEGKTESEVQAIMTTLRVLVGGLGNAVEETMREGIEQLGAGSLK